MADTKVNKNELIDGIAEDYVHNSGDTDDITFGNLRPKLDNAVFPSGTLDITSNGTQNVRQYESVNVQTPVPTGTIDIAANDTYNVSQYASAEVNVPVAADYIDSLTLNAAGSYAIVDENGVSHTIVPTETDGQITSLTYDGGNVPLRFTDDLLTGIGETDVDVSRYPYGRLPIEYQEVEYIEATGTQYIDTGLYLADFKELYSEIAFTQIDETTQYSGLYDTNRSWAVGIRGTNHIAWAYPTTYSSQYLCETNITPTVNQKYKIFASAPLKSVRVKNQTGYSQYVGYSSGTDTLPFLIGARNHISSGVELYCHARYSDWIFYDYDSNNEIAEVAHFIPCYRKSDNEIGMYDKVRNVFKGNAGTGTFLKGGDV